MIRKLRRMFGLPGAEHVSPARSDDPVPTAAETATSPLSSPAEAPRPPAGPAPKLSPTRLKPKYDVFIAYSHEDWEQAKLLQRDLEACGLRVWRDDRLHAAPERNAADSIHEAFLLSARVLVLWSDDSVHSYWLKEEAEAARTSHKLVGLALTPAESLPIPAACRSLPTVSLAEIRTDPALLLRDLGAVEDPARPGCFTLVQPQLNLEHLPPDFATGLYGRDRELDLLTRTWDTGGPNVIAFHAIPGAGKTALVVHFVQALQACGWRGARAVFAWSFAGQDVGGDPQGDSAAFFESAFAFFAKGPSGEWQARQAQAVSEGFEERPWPPRDEREKGLELALHIQKQRTLLLLDGLEPLQYPESAAGGGTDGGVPARPAGGIKDPALSALLESLADQNPGLCLVTTRLAVEGFRDRTGFRAAAVDPLDSVAGIRLLRGLGVESDYPSEDFHAWRKTYAGEDRFSSGHRLEPVPEGIWHLPTYRELTSRLAAEIQSCHVPRDFKVPDDLEPGFAGIDRSHGATLPAAVALKLLLTVLRFDGHALSLTLLANYLRAFHHGSIDAAREVPLLEIYRGPERGPFSVLRAVEIGMVRHLLDPSRDRRQHPGETDAGRRLALLLFLGLFDRPAPTALLRVVFPDVPLAFDPAHDPPADVTGLEPIYRRHDEPDEAWRAYALRVETERRDLFRSLLSWTAGYSGEALAHTLSQLAAQGLVHKPRNHQPWERARIDCQPLVRSYFANRLRALDPAGIQAAHGRIYDHLRFRGLPEPVAGPVSYAALALHASDPERALPLIRQLAEGTITPEELSLCPPALVEASLQDPAAVRAAAALLESGPPPEAQAPFLPEDAAGLEPLFEAVRHGCLSGRAVETWAETYWPRISRGEEQFAARSLHLHGPNLAALAAFFDEPFLAPHPHFDPARQALLQHLSAIALRSLGRLLEAVAPLRRSVATSLRRADDSGLASRMCRLSEWLILLGILEDSAGEPGAVTASAQAARWADQHADLFCRMAARAEEAASLFARGHLLQAEQRFREAELLQKEWQPELPRLYSLPGFLYGSLLVARGRLQEVEERYQYHLSIRQPGDSLLDFALEEINHGRASCALEPPGFGFGSAIAALRNTGREDDLPRACLIAAECGLRQLESGDRSPESARQVVDALASAEAIARRGPMPLFLADAHLLRARLALALGEADAAWRHRTEAVAFIAKHHYGRREPDLAVLDAEMSPSLETFHGACAKVGGEGWWHLLPRLEALAGRIPGAEPGLAALRASEAAYHAERDAYLAGQA